MKNLKKVLSVLLSLLLVLGAVAVGGTSVLAAEEYNLWVGGVKVTDDNKDDVFGDGTVSYDPASRTLKLNNANITGEYSNSRILSEVSNLTIVLVGDNVISDGRGSGLFCRSGNLTITGNGTLGVSADAYSIYSNGNLTIENAYVVANSNLYSIYSNGNLTIENASVIAKSNGVYSIVSDTALTITNSYVSAESTGICIFGDSLILDNVVITEPVGGLNNGRKITLNEQNVQKAVIQPPYSVNLSANPTAGGTVSSGGLYNSGSTATVTATPNEHYCFVNWTENGDEVSTDAEYSFTVTGHRELVANFEIQKFTVQFVNEDGTELQSRQVIYGGTPAYTGEMPTKEATAQYTYSFLAWTPAIVPVTDDATYTAAYTQAPREYEIKFVNEDGSELQKSDVAYGETPVYTGETPTKEQSDQYVYTFGGWSPEITNVTGEATYTATFTQTPRKYEIKFVNEDGTELQSSPVIYGETPVYTGETPTKEQSDQYEYTFGGWSPEITNVTGEATYTATFTQAPRKYEIKFVNEDGTVLQSSDIAYGETPEYKGEPPVKAETDKATYTFKGWSPEIAPVTGEATYTAAFTETKKDKPADDKPAAKAAIAIKGEDALTLGYKQNKTFTADTEGVPEGGKVQWYLNGEKAGEGKTFKVENPEDDYTVQSKIVDKDGNTVAESETVKVTVKHGFFDKLKAWLTDLLLGVFAPLFSKFESVC